MDDQELIERIDACRPDSEDFRDADLAPLAEELAADPACRRLYERVQQLDAAIGAAMEDVPLPAGLQARLLARLAEAQAAEPAEALVDGDVSVAGEATQQPPAVITRRTWLWTAASVAVAASIAVVALVGRGLWPGQVDLTPAMIQEGAIAFYGQEQPEPGRDLHKFPAKYPLSRSITRTAQPTWRHLENFLGRPGLSGVAFDLLLSGTEATLYVVPGRTLALPTAPPDQPIATTAGRSAAAWREGDLIYVLVVDGNASAYQRFVRRTTIT
jgi:hypothetical protein